MFLSKDHSALVQGLRDIRKTTVRVWNLHMVALSVRGHLYSGISAASFYQEIQWPNWLQLLETFAILGLESLELRRLHQDLIYTYKAIFDLIDIDCSKFFTVSPYSSTRGHD